MEIEKRLTVAAAPAQVWALLLDPQVMAGAVPGMKSIEVISPTEYVAVMHQKISFISAKFKLRTRIVEQRAPEYLCAEGTGEDASVASSLKQRSEVFLMPTADGGTELCIKVSVDLLGRLGTFGLSVMKTKADRLWEEFGANLKARIEAGDLPSAASAPGRSLRLRRSRSLHLGCRHPRQPLRLSLRQRSINRPQAPSHPLRRPPSASRCRLTWRLVVFGRACWVAGADDRWVRAVGRGAASAWNCASLIARSAWSGRSRWPINAAPGCARSWVAPDDAQSFVGIAQQLAQPGS
jgi:carbon monoxide dehydrogenase subunit G